MKLFEVKLLVRKVVSAVTKFVTHTTDETPAPLDNSFSEKKALLSQIRNLEKIVNYQTIRINKLNENVLDSNQLTREVMIALEQEASGSLFADSYGDVAPVTLVPSTSSSEGLKTPPPPPTESPDGGGLIDIGKKFLN